MVYVRLDLQAEVLFGLVIGKNAIPVAYLPLYKDAFLAQIHLYCKLWAFCSLNVNVRLFALKYNNSGVFV